MLYVRTDSMVFLCVLLEITCYCYFYNDLSAALFLYSVVRSLLACLVWCFACIWFYYSIHWTSSVGRFISSACFIPSAAAAGKCPDAPEGHFGFVLYPFVIYQPFSLCSFPWRHGFSMIYQNSFVSFSFPAALFLGYDGEWYLAACFIVRNKYSLC